MLKLLAGMTAALALLGAAAGPSAAQVPDPYARELAGLLARGERPMVERGLTRAAGPFAGELAAGESRTFNVTLRANQRYEIMGVCEARCAGIDMRVLDDQVVLSRGAGARRLSIAAAPNVTGPHVLEVRMRACAAPVCYFALNIYSG